MKLKEKNDLPVGLIPELRLSLVPRWGIVDMSRKQSVAEHVFNVVIIVEWICKKMDMKGEHIRSHMVAALRHDNKEVYTGDVPSVSKEDSTYNPNKICALADKIEAYRYARKYCVDTEDIKAYILKNLKKEILEIISGISFLTFDQDIQDIMERS